jgi:hypothetical protein
MKKLLAIKQTALLLVHVGKKSSPPPERGQPGFC